MIGKFLKLSGFVLLGASLVLAVLYAVSHTTPDPAYVANALERPVLYPMEDAPRLVDWFGTLTVFVAGLAMGGLLLGLSALIRSADESARNTAEILRLMGTWTQAQTQAQAQTVAAGKPYRSADVPDKTCGVCGKLYTGMRTSCPHCGARETYLK